MQYVIAGIGEDAEYLDDLIGEHNLRGIVHRIGAVSEEDLPRWMNACDVFAMPNREINGDNEGFGMVFIEAGACGKLVLDAGGTGAAVLNGLTGLRVDGTSVKAVANGLIRLLSGKDDVVEMGQSGWKRVQTEFAWDKVAEKTHALSRNMKRGDKT